MSKYEEIDLSKLKLKETEDIKYKMDYVDSALNTYRDQSMYQFMKGLPQLLKSKNLLDLIHFIKNAKTFRKQIILMIGGHVIKSGCSRLLCQLVKDGYVTHIASTTSAVIHDYELSVYGRTSECVDDNICDGTFGMNRQTSEFLNTSASIAKVTDTGYGESVGDLLNQRRLKFDSLVRECYRRDVPYTIHVAIGTDIVHQYPKCDGSAIGDASMRDFRIFVNSVSKLHDGGVLINFGSAVILPEVFLKAVSISRNIGELSNFTVANFDMIEHYRQIKNVVERPVANGNGRGYSFIGHHEIMIPLLVAGIYNS